MVDHIFVQCDYCKTKLLLRFQMGYFDIPFDICCPDCGVHIHGLRKIVNEQSTTVNNASVIESELDNVDYYADFSVELPHAKTRQYKSLKSLTETGFSPFMMSAGLYGNSYLDLVKHLKTFLSFRDSCWPKLTPLFDLFFNGRVSLTEDHFLKLSPRFVVKNKLDALMALHQTLVLGMNSILADGTLGRFIDTSKQIAAPANLTKLDALTVALGGEDQFNSLEKRLVKIYGR